MPAEILHRICAAIEPDVQCYRLVNRTFAANLRALSISGCSGEGLDWSPPLSTLIGDTTWSSLRTLRLSNFDCTETELRDVISRHGEHLEELCLTNVELEQGNAGSLLQSFAGKLESLRKVELRGSIVAAEVQTLRFGDPDQIQEERPFIKAMQSFVVEGGEMPDLDGDWD